MPIGKSVLQSAEIFVGGRKLFGGHSIPRCKPALKVWLSRPDSLPESGQKVCPHPCCDPLRLDLLPMRIAAPGHRVAEDIIRVLTHAKIGND